MSNNHHIIKCSLCEKPTGISFEKQNFTIYCYTCGEAIIKLKNMFKKDDSKFISFWDLPQQENINLGLTHKYNTAVNYYINKLEQEK